MTKEIYCIDGDKLEGMRKYSEMSDALPSISLAREEGYDQALSDLKKTAVEIDEEKIIKTLQNYYIDERNNTKTHLLMSMPRLAQSLLSLMSEGKE